MENEPKTTNEHASALGKLGRGKTSERKSKSSRENGKKGGRPKKIREQEAAIGSAFKGDASE